MMTTMMQTAKSCLWALPRAHLQAFKKLPQVLLIKVAPAVLTTLLQVHPQQWITIGKRTTRRMMQRLAQMLLSS